MKYLIALAALVALTGDAAANCSCTCRAGKLVTTCASPANLERCRGECLGDMCLGLCRPDRAQSGGIAEQNRVEHEMKEYHFRYAPKRAPGGAMEH